MREALRIGAATRDITPAVGSELSGFIARVKPSVAVADSLHVRAVVARSDTNAVAIVQADLLGFAPWHVAEVRDFAWRRLGIPHQAVLLSTTHTHSGPGVVQVRGCAVAQFNYQRALVEDIQATLEEAQSNLLPARMALGSFPYDLGINRREETLSGVVLGSAPGKAHPKELGVARFDTPKQQIFLFSHACHPYILGSESLLISGDFPSFACAQLERDSRGIVAIFLNGCAGNIAPKSAFQGIEKAREEGARLAAAVGEGFTRLEPFKDLSLNADSSLSNLPYTPLPSEQELAVILTQEERVVRPQEKMNPEIQSRIRAALDEWRTLMSWVIQRRVPLAPVHCELQGVRIGPLTLLGISGEPFFEIGEKIRATSHAQNIWPLGYTNSYCGYIATRDEYPRGGYEVDDSWKYVGLWKIDITAEDKVVKTASEVLGRIARTAGNGLIA
jgi:neutral ceramidase